MKKHLALSGHSRWTWLRCANKRCHLWHSWALPDDLKNIEACFLQISTDLLCLRAAQMPRSRDQVIFVLTTDNRQNWLLYPLHACTCEVITDESGLTASSLPGVFHKRKFFLTYTQSYICVHVHVKPHAKPWTIMYTRTHTHIHIKVHNIIVERLANTHNLN